MDITRDLSMEAKLKRISEAREYVISHAPSRPTLAQLREEERVLEQSVAGLERHVQDLQHYGRREQRLEQRREPREWREELAAERVLAAGKTHGLPRDQQAEQMVAKLERTERLRDAAQQLRELAHTLGHDEPSRGRPCGSRSLSGRRNASATRGEGGRRLIRTLAPRKGADTGCCQTQHRCCVLFLSPSDGAMRDIVGLIRSWIYSEETHARVPITAPASIT